MQGSPQVLALFRSSFSCTAGLPLGVDNDDGSSFYDINENIFFDADGFKMDYVSKTPAVLMLCKCPDTCFISACSK